MKAYTVKQLARLSGVSVRTLHHYDEIGLLKPAFVGENRYRYYGRDELLRLQDILFHRELGVPLNNIGRALDNGGRDRVSVLAEQRELLLRRVQRSRQLIRTIDRTIAELKGEKKMTDRDLYKGFSAEKQADYEDWLVERYGSSMRERIEQSKETLAAMSNADRRAQIEALEPIETGLAEAMAAGTAPDDPSIDPLVDRHRQWVAAMWGRECSLPAYRGLADLYDSHPDFRQRFERIASGFADWLTSAMRAYVDRQV